MRAIERLVVGVLAAIFAGDRVLSQQVDRRQLERIEQALRQEGEAVVALADRAAHDAPLPADFPLAWHNDFLKARTGTFIPFVVSIGIPEPTVSAALLYVRVTRRPSRESPGRRQEPARDGPSVAGTLVAHPFEEIYPIQLLAGPGPVRVARGFSLPPGEYEVIVVVREREHQSGGGGKRMAALLRRPLSVPDFSGAELTTSTIMLAERLRVLPHDVPDGEVQNRPYLIGGREITPAVDRSFGRNQELIVIFLVYNPPVTAEEQFDLEVEYYFSRQTGTGETYFNRTEPQRFNPSSLGPRYDPSAGHPVMAGQAVPLAGFPAGDYRLTIRVRDRIAGRTVSRDVTFTVRPEP